MYKLKNNSDLRVPRVRSVSDSFENIYYLELKIWETVPPELKKKKQFESIKIAMKE